MSEASSDKERSGQEPVDGPAVRVVSGYCASRRTPRKHKRVVRQGTELFDADGVKLEPSDVLTDRQRAAVTSNASSPNCPLTGASSPNAVIDPGRPPGSFRTGKTRRA